MLMYVHVTGKLVLTGDLSIACPPPPPLQDGRVMDSVMVVKEKHGPEAWL